MNSKRMTRRQILKVAGTAPLLVGLTNCGRKSEEIKQEGTSQNSKVSVQSSTANETTIRLAPVNEQAKPFMAKFEVPLPKEISEAEFNAKITGTGPKTTRTGGSGGTPSDTAADVDVDF